MDAQEDLNLVPPVIEFGRFEELVKAGQTICSSLSPADNSFAVFLKNAVSSNVIRRGRYTKNCFYLKSVLAESSDNEDEQPVYFVSRQAVPSSERRLVRQMFVEVRMSSKIESSS